MNNIFLNEKPVMALVTIRKANEEIYGSIISREIDTTYAHTVKIIAQLEEKGLIKSEKKGRKKILTLTEEGKKCGDLFIDMLETFQECEDGSSPDLSMDAKEPRLKDNEI